MVRTRLVCLENTHNRWGGRIQPQREVQRICDWAERTAQETSRRCPAVERLGRERADASVNLAEPFDSVSVCFSKGLGAPVGSALAGPKNSSTKRAALESCLAARCDKWESSPPARSMPSKTTAIGWSKITPTRNRLGDACEACRPIDDSWRSHRHQHRRLRDRPGLGNGGPTCHDACRARGALFCDRSASDPIRDASGRQREQIEQACEIIKTLAGTPFAKSV